MHAGYEIATVYEYSRGFAGEGASNDSGVIENFDFQYCFEAFAVAHFLEICGLSTLRHRHFIGNEAKD